MDTPTAADGYPFAVYNTAAALVDGAGILLAWTAAAEGLLGRRAEDVCGRPVTDLLADPAAHRAEAPAPCGSEVREGRATLRHGSGGELEVLFRVTPLSGAGHRHAPSHLILAAPADVIARWREDHALAGELFAQDRIGLAVFDASLRLVRTNTPLLPYTGVPPDLRGLRLGDFLWAQDAEMVDAQLGRVLRTGEPVVGFTTLARTLEDPRGGRFLTFSAFRLQEPGGQLLGVAVTYTDTTEEHRAQERLAVLHRATAALGGSLSAEQTSRDLADVLVPAFADRVAVDVADAVFDGSEPVPDRYGRVAQRRTATAGAGAEEPGSEAPAGGDDLAPPPLAQGRGFLVRDARGSTGDQAAGWARAVPGARSAISAPLSARDTQLGTLTLWRTEPDRPAFDEADLVLVREVAARVGLALDNARRYTREHLAAVSLQRSLLPPATADMAAVRTASVYLPADPVGGVSGDWYDVIPLSSARVALVVGDVVGHGLRATASMGRLRTAVRTLADLDPEPDELLTHLDDLVMQLPAEPGPVERAGAAGGAESPERIGAAHGPDRGRVLDTASDGGRDSFAATCLYAVYDPVSGRCALASAGHPPPALLEPDGTASYIELNPGPPLGVGGLPFEKAVVDLAPGSVLALYTDGLIERGEGDVDEGMAQLRERLVRADALHSPLHGVVQQVVAGLPPTRLPDDVTLLVARTRCVPPEDTATWTLDADPAVVAEARELVARQLAVWGLESLLFTTELVVSELVTNAIRYAGGPVGLRMIRTDVLTCEVSDPSGTQPRMRRARATDEGGRGLYLVAQLTSRWGSRYTRQGKTIWAEQPLPRPLPLG
ncbi:SpoIIE family protein phosphatase [Streptomyces sp. XD-27]|uniref:ATP-binding SpoIIE family protein phosphatase n=1 Tax=Streptomyces sp. XD-27 TaxID=3062779 RepID=UPI0026F46683|nr:SpoIIE family protein phosphatase [Streptomyces sp. XD-27]WKX68707.1 SpoIIE family protein phosphatase [Streptomyces sp. XD-27]